MKDIKKVFDDEEEYDIGPVIISEEEFSTITEDIRQDILVKWVEELKRFSKTNKDHNEYYIKMMARRNKKTGEFELEFKMVRKFITKQFIGALVIWASTMSIIAVLYSFIGGR